MDEYFKVVMVYAVNAIQGTLVGFHYSMLGLKSHLCNKDDCLSGGLFMEGYITVGRNWNEGNQVCTTAIENAQPNALYICHCHVVDDHKKEKHVVPLCEFILEIERWPFCIVTFLLAVTRVNVFLHPK